MLSYSRYMQFDMVAMITEHRALDQPQSLGVQDKSEVTCYHCQQGSFKSI